MQKRFTLADLSNIKNQFIPNLCDIITKEIKRPQDRSFSNFLKLCFEKGDEIYFFQRSDVVFRCALQGSLSMGMLTLIDEREKIEIVLSPEEKGKFATLVNKMLVKQNTGNKKKAETGLKTIEEILVDEFRKGSFIEILDKPYLVYDIETTVVDDLKSAEYLLGYAMYPEVDKMRYECVMKEDLKGFVDEMLAFDGYIVGFNQIWFDNPVSVWNAGYGQKEIDILNKKSIDLYVFFQHLTKKRIGLNKLSEALIGVTKTLSSGAEGEVLWKKYQETGDKQYLEEFKQYCKNDVRMTALVMFYFLYKKEIFYEGGSFKYSLEEFVEKSNHNVESYGEKNFQVQSLF